MKEGMYSVNYLGSTGTGFGVLVFDTGVVWGVDVGGVLYDGTYTFNQRTSKIDAKITMTVPAGIQLVTEARAPSDARKTTLEISLPREFDKSTEGTVNVFGQQVRFVIQKARNAPSIPPG